MGNRVKHPSAYYRENGVKYRDAIARLQSNYNACGDSYERITAGGFGSYDLKTHGLNYPQGYGRGEIVSRIIAERSGEPYLVGIELEVEGATEREAIADVLHKYLPKKHICVSDGSLRDSGIEIVTSPLAKREVRAVAWYNLLRQLSRLGCVSHDSGRCGLHVSISRQYLREETWSALRTFLTRNQAFFKAISRRDPRGERSDPFHFCRFLNSTNKYRALNLGKKQVAEFRFFRGTLNPVSFVASLELVYSLVEYAKTVELGAQNGRISLRTRQWIAFASGNQVLAKHIAPHVALLTAPRVRGSGAPRARLTDEQRRGRFAQRIAHTGSYSMRLESRGAAIAGTVDGGRYLPVRYGIGIERGELLPRSYRIDWSRSSVPQYVRRLVERGCGVEALQIVSDQVPDRECVAVFRYNRAGWGQSAFYTIELTEAR